MSTRNFPNPAFFVRNQRESVMEIAQRQLGVVGLVPCRDAAAMVSFLPFLDTPYELIGRSGHIELCFGTMTDARRFFEEVRRSGDVEQAELRASTGARTRGRLVDDFGSGERSLLENQRSSGHR